MLCAAVEKDQSRLSARAEPLPDGAEAMGKLTAFYDRFAALDGVKEYLERRQKVWGLPGSRAQPA